MFQSARTRSGSLLARAVALALLALGGAPALAQAVTYQADDLVDATTAPCAGTTGCTLRGAVLAANASPGVADTIVVAPGTHELLRGGIAVTDDLTIESATGGRAVIDGLTVDRHLAVSKPLTLRSVDLVNGRSAAQGGAIDTSAALTLDDVTIADSGVGGSLATQGGAIYAHGGPYTLTIERSRLLRNRVAALTVSARGGAIATDAQVTATISDTVVEDNQVDGPQAARGGGLAFLGPATLTNVTVEGNSATPGYGAEVRGGGVYTSAPLTVSASRLASNTATASGPGLAWGGGLYAQGATLDLQTSTFRANAAVGDGADGMALGGGYTFNAVGGTVTAVDVHVAENRAEARQADGGGARVTASAHSVDRSAFTGNLAAAGLDVAQGGGLSVFGDLTLRASTVHGNRATSVVQGRGGGVAAQDALWLEGTTITANEVTGSTPLSGGLLGDSSAPVHLAGSIVAGNVQPAGTGDCDIGRLVLQGGNVVAPPSSSCSVLSSTPSDLLAADPMLGPLAIHDGRTPTALPLDGSPALDRWDATACQAATPVDQRGIARPAGAACDAGAAEARVAGFVFADGAVAFDPVEVGKTGAATTLTLTNVGERTGTPALALSGAGAASFVLDPGTCGAAVAAKATCAATVRLKPGAAGALAATLDGLLGPVALTGTGVAPPPDPDPDPDPEEPEPQQPEQPGPQPSQPSQPQPAAPQPPRAATPLAPPAPHWSVTCRSRRAFTLRLELARTLRAVRVTVDGTPMQVRRSGRRLVVRVDLRGRPRATVTLRITGTSKGGKRIRETRTYRTCMPARA